MSLAMTLMTPAMTPGLIVSLCAVLGSGLLLGSSLSSGRAVKVAVSTNHHEHSTASLTLSVDGRSVCKIALAEQESWDEREACAFELPPTAREIAVSGEFAYVGSDRPPPTRGNRRWKIVDIAPLMSPLRDTSRPFGQRIRAFLQAKKAFEKAHPALSGNVEIETSTGATLEAVKAAEARLKFPLPPEHVSFLREIGRLTVGSRGDESFSVSAESLQRASRQIIDIWELPAGVRKRLKPSTIALLEASTMLYTWNDHSYGYSALLYEPSLPGRPSACGQQAAFHRLNADMINDPVPWKNSDEKKTCPSYTQVIVPVLLSDLLNGWEEQGPELVLIDRSAPNTSHLLLRYAPHEDLFPFEVSPLWHKFE
jgi:hypothetical protein